jgi:hypothetical protein
MNSSPELPRCPSCGSADVTDDGTFVPTLVEPPYMFDAFGTVDFGVHRFVCKFCGEEWRVRQSRG